MVFSELESKIRIRTAVGKKHFKMSRGSFVYKDSRSKVREAELRFQGEVNGTKHFFAFGKGGEKIAEVSFSSSADRTELDFSITDGKTNRAFLTFPCGAGEHFFGGGEVFTKFDLRGEKIRIWSGEHQNAKRIARKVIRMKLMGKRSQKAQRFSKYESYYVQPTFVSSRKYFFHLATSDYSEVDFRASDSVTLLVHGSFRLIFEKADSFTHLSGKIADELGHQAELPDWIYDGMIFGIQKGTETIEKNSLRSKNSTFP